MARASLLRMVKEAPGLLAGGASFNGTTMDVANSNNVTLILFSEVRAAVFADQAGSLKWQTSYDNVTWRDVAVATPVPANTYTIVKASPTRRFMRAVFTNTSGVAFTVSEMETVAVSTP